jgi:hypothetical protein
MVGVYSTIDWLDDLLTGFDTPPCLKVPPLQTISHRTQLAKNCLFIYFYFSLFIYFIIYYIILSKKLFIYIFYYYFIILVFFYFLNS